MAEERVEECGGSQSSLRDRTSRECLYVLFVILVHMCLQTSICLVGADLENETRVLGPITTDLLEKSRSSIEECGTLVQSFISINRTLGSTDRFLPASPDFG